MRESHLKNWYFSGEIKISGIHYFYVYIQCSELSLVDIHESIFDYLTWRKNALSYESNNLTTPIFEL